MILHKSSSDLLKSKSRRISKHKKAPFRNITISEDEDQESNLKSFALKNSGTSLSQSRQNLGVIRKKDTILQIALKNTNQLTH